MDKVSGRLTVFFEEPFWVGVIERISEDRLSVCKITFGAEPRDYEIYDFIMKNYCLLRFSPDVAADAVKEIKNPKRAQREARRQVLNSGVGTKSQQALKLQREQMKAKRRAVNRERKAGEKQHLFELKQHKRKEKRRGR